jgi:hypothetical protein
MTTQTKTVPSVQSLVKEVAEGSRSLSSVLRGLKESIDSEEAAISLAADAITVFGATSESANKWKSMLNAATEMKFISAGLMAAAGATDVKIGSTFGVKGDAGAILRITGLLSIKELVKDKADQDAEAITRVVKDTGETYGAYSAQVIFTLVNDLKTKRGVSITALRRVVKESDDRKSAISTLKEMGKPTAESTAEDKLKSMAASADKLSGLAKGDAAKALEYAKAIVSTLCDLYPEAAPTDEDSED